MPIIHLQWDGPFTLEQIKEMNNAYDYGVYTNNSPSVDWFNFAAPSMEL